MHRKTQIFLSAGARDNVLGAPRECFLGPRCGSRRAWPWYPYGRNGEELRPAFKTETGNVDFQSQFLMTVYHQIAPDCTDLHFYFRGDFVAQWLRRWIRDRKIAGSTPNQSATLSLSISFRFLAFSPPFLIMLLVWPMQQLCRVVQFKISWID